MACRYYTDRELANILNVSGEDFHRKIKKSIKADFRKELNNINVLNPDIWLNENSEIRLVDPTNSSNFYETGLRFDAYL